MGQILAVAKSMSPFDCDQWPVYNKAMRRVTFYTKLECSLCEEAYRILLDVALDTPLEIDIVDITHTPGNLQKRYRTRIPVLALDNGMELDWPFSALDITSQLG